MHCFIHIVTDEQRIVDPEGEEFADLEAARLGASQSARDLMANELVAGRPVPFGWRVQVADLDGTVLLTIPFASLAFGQTVGMEGWKFPRVAGPEVLGRARATMLKAHHANGDVLRSIGELWSHLRTLSDVNATLGKTFK
jgi:hypothetical protein